MGFHEIQFPTKISYGSSGGPGFNTTVITNDAGAEERIGRWSSSRRKYDVSYGAKTYEDLLAIQEFYIARNGATHGFRYKDWLDFSSSKNSKLKPVAFEDQIIGIGDGNTTTFQLIKKYISGEITHNRIITKPISGTVRIGVDGMEQTSGWSVNTATGIITFTSAPADGTQITAGFEFDTPVRFALGQGTDDFLDISIDTFNNGKVSSIPLVEIIADDSLTSDEFYYGGASAIALSANTSISVLNGRVLDVMPSTSGLKVALPDTTDLSCGGPYFFIHNASGDYTFEITNSNGDTVVIIAVSDTVEIILGKNADGDKVWFAL